MTAVIAAEGTLAGVDPYANPKSLEYKFRKRRYSWLKLVIDHALETKGSCRVLDMGGSPLFWATGGTHIDNPNIQVDILNLDVLDQVHMRPNFRLLIGDACDLPDMKDHSYDLVHANSLIEHVGPWAKMRQMAANVRRLAPEYFVQTPYFGFPIEPHFRFPCWHWLPEQVRYRLLMRKGRGFIKRAESVDEAVQLVQFAQLLDETQMRTLFPDASIRRERFYGLTKALIAVRRRGD